MTIFKTYEGFSDFLKKNKLDNKSIEFYDRIEKFLINEDSESIIEILKDLNMGYIIIDPVNAIKQNSEPIKFFITYLDIYTPITRTEITKVNSLELYSKFGNTVRNKIVDLDIPLNGVINNFQSIAGTGKIPGYGSEIDIISFLKKSKINQVKFSIISPLNLDKIGIELGMISRNELERNPIHISIINRIKQDQNKKDEIYQSLEETCQIIQSVFDFNDYIKVINNDKILLQFNF